MPDLSRIRTYNSPAKSPAVRAGGAALPRHNRGTAKPAALAGVLQPLPNAAGLPVVAAITSSLPRESLPRIMNPAGVPLTDAARFVSPL
jgi:hypothetical protein